MAKLEFDRKYANRVLGLLAVLGARAQTNDAFISCHLE